MCYGLCFLAAPQNNWIYVWQGWDEKMRELVENMCESTMNEDYEDYEWGYWGNRSRELHWTLQKEIRVA